MFTGCYVKIYQNNYFNFKVELPENWTLQSWSNWKEIPENPQTWQNSDDDIPSVDECKTLFRAWLRIPESSSIVSAVFSMELYQRENFFDLSQSMKIRPDEVGREFKFEKIMGRECQVVSFVSEGGEVKRFVKSFLWKERSEIWLGASIDADSIEYLSVASQCLQNAERLCE